MNKGVFILLLCLAGCGEIDRCLDAGGSYDYENRRCDFEKGE